MNLSIIRPLILASLVSGMVSCGGSDNKRDYFPLPDRNLEVIQSEMQSFQVDTVLSGLNRPWSMEFLPDNRLLITEREGNIKVVSNGRLQETDLQGDIPSGLRDIKLHPQFEENGWIYLSYYIEPGEETGGYTALMRVRLQGERLTEEEILYTAGPFRNGGEWTGSRIVFDNEGYLYFAVGIRGARMNSQDRMHHSGKIMRFHDDGTVPDGNPFRDDPESLPEIYTYGHREHQGLVLHPENGEIWATEHGEMGGDELNRIEAGANHGWPLATHSLEYDGSVITEDPFLEGTNPPVHFWTPSIGPSGLDFTTGDRYSGWSGDLFTGSMAQRMLNHTIIEDGRIVRDEKLLDQIGRVRSVRFAPDGYLYLITEDTGLMIRLLPFE